MDDGTALKTECYPIAVLPGLSRLFLDFAERREVLAPFFPASAYSTQWMTEPPELPPLIAPLFATYWSSRTVVSEQRIRSSRISLVCATEQAQWSPANR